MTDTKIDWERFAARVQAGYMVRVDLSTTAFMYSERYVYGVLLENHPARAMETIYNWRARDIELGEAVEGDAYEEWFGTALRVQPYTDAFYRETEPWNREPNQLEYLIDGRWVTFEQVMAGEAS